MDRWALGAKAELDIRRDEHGVVHVRGSEEADLYRGLGYVHAFERGLQMLLVRILGRGRAAEILAASDEMLALDRFFRRLDLAREAAEGAGRLAPRHRTLIEAYCEGANAAFRLRTPWELGLRRYRPEPWTFADVVLTARMVGYVGLAQSQADMERLFVELVQAGVGRDRLEELFPGLLEGVDFELLGRVRLGERIVPAAVRQSPILPRALASNNWAIAGRRTRSGLPILANDPHLEGNRLPAVWCEVVLELGERFCVAATLPGIPGPILGRTNDLAWGATYTFMDAVDSWIEDCRDGCYRRVGPGGEEWVPFKVRREVIERRGKAPVTVTFHENEHGTLAGDPSEAGLLLATRWSAGAGTGVSIGSFIDMLHAPDVESGRQHLGQIETAFNWVLADRHGSIGYQMSGRMPVRRAGWNGFVPVPGWDPANDWQGFVPFADLPRALDPADGFLVTANDDLNHLGRVAPINLPMGPYRAERIARLLSARDDWSAADVEGLQMDVYSIQAERFLAVLRPLLPASPEGEALRNWDCRYDPASREATLFERFYRELFLEVLGPALGGDAVRHLLDETGVLADFYFNFDRVFLAERNVWFGPDGRDAVFARVANRALARPGRRWGEERQLLLKNLVLGGRLPRWLGLDVGPLPLRGGRATVHQGQLYRSGGRSTSFVPSYRMVTDLAEPVLRTSLAGGPSDRPFSRWYASDVERWAAGRCKQIRPRDVASAG